MNTRFTSTTLLAAITAVGLSIAPAFADAQTGNSGYVFPRFGEGAPAQQAPVRPPRAWHGATNTYATHSNEGTWLFPPDPEWGGANS